VSLAAVADEAWRTVETGEAALEIASDPTVLADEGRLVAVLENLFRNAVEHGTGESTSSETAPRGDGETAADGEAGGDEEGEGETGDDGVRDGDQAADAPSVTVTVGALPDGFFVADDGPGIPPSDREQVLEMGYSTSREGTGFGLAIVAEIAEAHGWDVAITGGSPAEDTRADDGTVGARFEFTDVDMA
jgi:signal transduction histidine kinase